MLQVFFSSILPIFGVVFLGYLGAMRGVFDAAQATALNRYVFMVALPALMFGLVAGSSFENISWTILFGYLAVEVAVMTLGAVLARRVFQRPPIESALLGMTAGFSNHVFVVLPITMVLAPEAADVVVTVILFDSVLIFSTAILALDASTASPEKRGGALGAILRNPPILAILVGGGAAVSGAPMPDGVTRFVSFLGDSAAPAALFALGVILAAQRSSEDAGASATIASLKVALAPLLVWAFLSIAVDAPPLAATAAIATAAGPCGAMPFVLALQFGAPTATIARAILISTAGSMPVLSYIVSWY